MLYMHGNNFNFFYISIMFYIYLEVNLLYLNENSHKYAHYIITDLSFYKNSLQSFSVVNSKLKYINK